MQLFIITVFYIPKDGLPPELLQANPSTASEIIFPHKRKAWLNKQLPSTWVLPSEQYQRKEDLTGCDTWRNITLLNNIYKVIAAIVNYR